MASEITRTRDVIFTRISIAHTIFFAVDSKRSEDLRIKESGLSTPG